jgi:hypothetical protein
VPRIVKSVVQPQSVAAVAALLFAKLDAIEIPERPAARVFRREAGFDVVLRLAFQMITQLVVKFTLNGIAAEKRA